MLSDEIMRLEIDRISEMLKDHHNLIVLAKGTGLYTAKYIA